jgi:hypothetical protein
MGFRHMAPYVFPPEDGFSAPDFLAPALTFSLVPRFFPFFHRTPITEGVIRAKIDIYFTIPSWNIGFLCPTMTSLEIALP